MKEVVLSIVHLAIDYLRWTQMVPMVLAWGMLILALLFALFASFKEESVVALIWLHEKTAAIPGLHDWIAGWVEGSGARNARGGITLNDEQLAPMFMTAWAVGGGVLMLLTRLYRVVRPAAPYEGPSLARKLTVVLVLVLVVFGAISIVLLFGGVSDEFRFANIFPMIAGAGCAVFLASAYSISVSQALGRLESFFSIL